MCREGGQGSAGFYHLREVFGELTDPNLGRGHRRRATCSSGFSDRHWVLLSLVTFMCKELDS